MRSRQPGETSHTANGSTLSARFSNSRSSSTAADFGTIGLAFRPVRGSHLREILEQGFEVGVVKDATAAAQHPELGDGYATALTNFGFIANAVLATDEALTALHEGAASAVS